MPGIDIVPLLAALSLNYSELASGPVEVLSHSWDSVALNAGNRMIFRFPRTEGSRAALRREVALLRKIRPLLPIAVPELVLHEAPLLFSAHPMIPGDHLPPDRWVTLADPAKARVADALARTFAALHRIPLSDTVAVGALPAQGWLAPDLLRDRVLNLLPEGPRARADRALDAIAALPPDPLGQVCGHFDAHGWNMAFDPAAGRLNGLYDFADAGLGPLHREFVAPSFVSAELTRLILPRYEALTGLSLDRARVTLLTVHLRLSELAGATADAGHRTAMLHNALAWLQPVPPL